MVKFLVAIGALLTVAMIGGLSIGAYAWSLLQPVASTSQPTQTFVIPKGQATSIIARRLAEQGLIRQPLAFRVDLRRQQLEKKLQAGSFKISPSMSSAEIAQILSTGTNDIWVTILEGWRREEIGESLARYELTEFSLEEFLDLTASAEGTLYPDTYLVPRQVTAEGMYDILTTTFDQKVVKGFSEKIEASDRSFEDILVMASLIEREAREYNQMRAVSGILWNRIEDGMSLDVDATLQYVKGYNQAEQNWWSPPLAVDKKLNSPFNTYLNTGLPPRPIANPSQDAIRAALDPQLSNNYFYIHDRDGNMHYGANLAEHNRNVNRYLR